MDNISKQKAFDDINFIKEVIHKTSISMLSLSSLFIKCGILFLVTELVFIVSSRIPVPCIPIPVCIANGNLFGLLLQVLSLISLPAMLIIPILIYNKIAKSNPLQGLSKKIMAFWTIIVLFIIICFITLAFSNIILSVYNPFNVVLVSNGSLSFYLFSLFLFLFAFGLFCINIFTSFKFPLILGIAYVCIGLFLMILQVPFIIYDVLIIPFTFLVIGYYFKLMRIRVN